MPGTFEPVYIRFAQGSMLGFSGGHSLSPHPEAGSKGVFPHEFNNLFFPQSKLNLYGFKGSPVFPCHLYYPVLIFGGDGGKAVFHWLNGLIQITAQLAICSEIGQRPGWEGPPEAKVEFYESQKCSIS